MISQSARRFIQLRGIAITPARTTITSPIQSAVNTAPTPIIAEVAIAKDLKNQPDKVRPTGA